MKIIILLIVLGIVLGTFLLAFVGAVSLGIIDKDFTKDILKISTIKICEAELLSATKMCNKDTKTEININQEILSITEDPKTKVGRIRNE